jgi:thermitase
MNQRHCSTSRCWNVSVSISLVITSCLLISVSYPFLMQRAHASSLVDDKFRSGSDTRIESFGSLNLLQNLQTPTYRKGELLIRFRGGLSQIEKDTIMATSGARLKKELRGESEIEKLEVNDNDDAATAALQLSLNPSVEFAEPNFLIAKDQLDSVLPNDPRFPEQWALKNTGQNNGQYGSDIGTTNAWHTTTGAQSTVIAVIDSGIDFTHPDLSNNEWTNPHPTSGDVHGWDYITDTSEIKDEQGHGTAIAGIIAAQGNNAQGVSGVMWRAGLMSLRVLDNTGSGDVGNAVEAIDYAVAHGAQVINLSWGTNAQSIALKDAIQRATRRGVTVVCSAGNGGKDIESAPYYPASFGLQDLIAVAGTDNFDRLASWSNWGSGIAVAAPGTDILTTQMAGG